MTSPVDESKPLSMVVRSSAHIWKHQSRTSDIRLRPQARNHLADGDGPDGEAYVGDGAGHVLDGRACPDEFTPIK